MIKTTYLKLKNGVAIGLCASLLSGLAVAQRPVEDVRIDDTEVFPESITSSSNGTLYVGSVKGNVYRSLPTENTAKVWIAHSEDNKILTILGVLADDSRNTLWLCSVPNFFGPERSEGVSSLMSFNLSTGEQTGIYEFPAPASVCNDITLSADGTAYAADTPNGRIFSLAPGAQQLSLFGEDSTLVGIDGLAFSEDGTLYVNNVQTNKIIRVEMDQNGLMGALTPLQIELELGGPDGFRLISGNRFIQAEGTIGRLSVVTIEGDTASLEILNDELLSSPGATTIGNTAYVIESNIQYLFDPSLQGQDPGDFMLYAVPLPQ